MAKHLKHSAGLQDLLSTNPNAKDYFMSLPDYVQGMISQRSDSVNSLESLQDYAENLLRGGYLMDDLKHRITAELDDRIQRLEQHWDDEIVVSDNQYDVLNQALAKVINVPLIGELRDIKQFVERL